MFASNYYLGQNHNAIEKHKILRWSEPDEIVRKEDVQDAKGGDKRPL